MSRSIKKGPFCAPELLKRVKEMNESGDKKALKLMAAERETTIAAIIHEWVQEHLKEVDE